MSKEKLPGQLGNEFGSGLRNTSHYEDTQRAFREGGITDAVLNQTPPVGLNLQILSGMESVASIAEELEGKSVEASILGLAIVDGVADFQRFLNTALRVTPSLIRVVEIDSAILQEVDALEMSKVMTLLKDARNTEIPGNSQDIVLRDHLGNCCPPNIDREIDREAARILKPGGIAIVNITTSELLTDSPGRKKVDFRQIKTFCPWLLQPLQEEVYDLAQLNKMFWNQFRDVRGKLLEIEENGSFVVFGEDENGHGEWFRPLGDHLSLWQKDGFEVLEIKSREGDDSHIPPLRCRRHNVILKKT